MGVPSAGSERRIIYEAAAPVFSDCSRALCLNPATRRDVSRERGVEILKRILSTMVITFDSYLRRRAMDRSYPFSFYAA